MNLRGVRKLLKVLINAPKYFMQSIETVYNRHNRE